MSDGVGAAFLNNFTFEQLDNESTDGIRLNPKVLQHFPAEDLLDLDDHKSMSASVQNALALKIDNGDEDQVLLAMQSLGGDYGAQKYLSRFEAHELSGIHETVSRSAMSIDMVPDFPDYDQIVSPNQLGGGHYARFAKNVYDDPQVFHMFGSTYNVVDKADNDTYTLPHTLRRSP